MTYEKILISYLASLKCSFTKIYKLPLTLGFYLVIISASNSQNLSIRDDSLLMEFRKEKDFAKAYPLFKQYISSKKQKNDNLEMAKAYFYLAYKKLSKDSCLKYLDTSFNYIHKLKDDPFLASLYWLKGQHYYVNRNFKNALQAYINADKFAKELGNEEYSFRSSQSIGFLNNRIGNYNEALKIFRNNYIYATKKNYLEKKSIRYLKTIFSLADVFNNLNFIDSASYYNKIGLKISKKNNQEYIHNLFLLSTGNTLRKKKLYNFAVDTISKSIDKFKDLNSEPNIAVGNYMLGMTYVEMGEKELSIKSFSIVDSIFNKTNDLLPRCRESYKYLINHFKEIRNYKKQLYYTNQLLKLDSILTDNYKFISKNIYNQLEKPKLISDKKDLEIKLNSKTFNYNIVFGLLSLVILILVILFRHTFKRKKKYAKLFSDLMDEKKMYENLPVNKKVYRSSLDSISKEIVDNIIQELNKFESNNEFLNKNITLTSLAKSINTNSNYLSKVINSIKGYTFSNYMNKLRIDYVIDRLKKDEKFRKYTIKAIAFEAGFKSSESFSKIFKKNTGLYPSYFIKKLNN